MAEDEDFESYVQKGAKVEAQIRARYQTFDLNGEDGHRALLAELGKIAWEASDLMRDSTDGVTTSLSTATSNYTRLLTCFSMMNDLLTRHVPREKPIVPRAEVFKRRNQSGGLEVGELLVSKDEVKTVFKTSTVKVNRRIREGGMSPHAALTVPDEIYKAMPEVQRLLTSWIYWCEREGVPPTDRAVFKPPFSTHPSAGVCSRGEWEGYGKRAGLKVNGWSRLERRYNRSGEESFAHYLWDARRASHSLRAEKTMLAWLSAAFAEFKICVPIPQAERARSTEEWKRERDRSQPALSNHDRIMSDIRHGEGHQWRPVHFDDYSYDSRTTAHLPSTVLGGFNGDIDKMLASLRVSGSDRDHVSNFDDLSKAVGFVAYVRKLLLPNLVVFDLNAANVRWLLRAGLRDKARDYANEVELRVPALGTRSPKGERQ